MLPALAGTLIHKSKNIPRWSSLHWVLCRANGGLYCVALLDCVLSQFSFSHCTCTGTILCHMTLHVSIPARLFKCACAVQCYGQANRSSHKCQCVLTHCGLLVSFLTSVGIPFRFQCGAVACACNRRLWAEALNDGHMHCQDCKTQDHIIVTVYECVCILQNDPGKVEEKLQCCLVGISCCFIASA